MAMKSVLLLLSLVLLVKGETELEVGLPVFGPQPLEIGPDGFTAEGRAAMRRAQHEIKSGHLATMET